jgi:ribosomal-protein-alanine N-acetyltransferase
MSRAAKRLPILETGRLRLNPLTPDDAAVLFEIMSDPKVMAHRDHPQIDDPELVAEIATGQVAEMAEGRALHWAIRELADDRFLGCCDLSQIDRWRQCAELGFLLARPAWGQGYAAEAMPPVIAHAAASGLRRLSARAHLGDRRADGLLRKLGFKEEKLLRGHVLRDGERRDCRLYRLVL